MAGHSKWANIKHRKAAQDAKRGKVFTKLIRELVVAAKSGTSLRLFTIDAASNISTINVDSPCEILSLAPTLVNILSKNPILSFFAGTKEPI